MFDELHEGSFGIAGEAIAELLDPEPEPIEPDEGQTWQAIGLSACYIIGRNHGIFQ